MKQKRMAIAVAAPMLALAAGCSSPNYLDSAPEPVVPTPTTARAAEYGTVRNISLVDVDRSTSGTGAVLGGVVGAVAGNQIGSGSGRVAATGAGAVGGAVLGNEIERRRGQAEQVYRVDVQTDQGELLTYQYRDLNGVQVGDRVRIQSGQLYVY